MIITADHDQLDENLFQFLPHYLLAKSVITEEKERSELSQLCLRAAKRAKVSSAYGPGVQYASLGALSSPYSPLNLQPGIEMLEPDYWTHQYQISFDLHLVNITEK